MADETPIAEGGEEPQVVVPIHDDDGHLSDAFIAQIRTALAADDGTLLRSHVDSLHEADLAAVIEALDADERTALIRLLGDDFDFTALNELDETLRVQILEALPAKTVAEGVLELDSDDAVALLEDLEPQEQAEILAELPPVERAAVARSLTYPEKSAGRLMQTEFIAVPPFWDVGHTIDYMREEEDLPEDFHVLFVVDADHHLVGTVPLDKLLRSKRPTPIDSIAVTGLQTVKATDNQEDVARLFERYNLVTVPVVDDDGRVVGVITIDDIVDVIEEEAEEDIRRLVGLGDEESSDTVRYVARSRIPWLLVNVFTAFLAAGVIGLFGASIKEMVALAILMPIVASLGGNAATQTMAVTVRALATDQLTEANTRRTIVKEILVALINGSAIAVITGLAAALYFQNPALGAVIAAALVGNILVAGLAGVLVPVAFDRLEIDPAVSSPVFVTMTTDVMGFLFFLGLAAASGLTGPHG